jgi:predicted amidohydrolase
LPPQGAGYVTLRSRHSLGNGTIKMVPLLSLRLEINLKRAIERIAEAAAHGSSMVLLPETLDLGWTDPSSLSEAEPIPEGTPFRRLSAAAALHKIFVCAGLTERDGDDIFNSAVIIDPDGELLSLHRKINEQRGV